jgi:dienelactone hydrolase
MRNLYLCILSLLWAGTLNAQLTAPDQPGPYATARLDTSFNDTFYSTGNIPGLSFYPVRPAGDTTRFPVVVLGHGFQMQYTDYNRILEHLASWGYVTFSPDVQNGFNTNHGTFARQLAACIRWIQAEGTRSGSRFHTRIAATSATCGHSMGGGAAQVSPFHYAGITAVSGLAPANTSSSTPSNLVALPDFTNLPAMFIGVQGDRVTPLAQHVNPQYDSLRTRKQKTISLIGGHCSFADAPDILCNFGATTSGEPAANGQQPLLDAVQNLSKRYLTAFYEVELKGNTAYRLFLCGDSALADARVSITEDQMCPTTSSVRPGLQSTTELRVLGMDRYYVGGARPLYAADLLGRRLAVQVERWNEGYSVTLPAHTAAAELLWLVTDRGVLRLPVVR